MIQFDLIAHDGPGRLGRLMVADATINTPSGCYFKGAAGGYRCYDMGGGGEAVLALPPSRAISRAHLARPTSRGKPLVMAAAYGPGPEEKPRAEERCAVVVSEDGTLRPDPSTLEANIIAFDPGVKADPAEVVEDIILLRERCSPNTAIIITGAEIWSFPLYSLVGADLFFDSHAWRASLRGEIVFDTYSVAVKDLPRNPCECPYCSAVTHAEQPGGLLDHNRWMTRRMLSEIRLRMGMQELKLMAEERSLRHPELHAALKRMYRKHGDYLEQFTTILPGVRT